MGQIPSAIGLHDFAYAMNRQPPPIRNHQGVATQESARDFEVAGVLRRLRPAEGGRRRGPSAGLAASGGDGSVTRRDDEARPSPGLGLVLAQARTKWFFDRTYLY